MSLLRYMPNEYLKKNLNFQEEHAWSMLSTLIGSQGSHMVFHSSSLWSLWVIKMTRPSAIDLYCWHVYFQGEIFKETKERLSKRTGIKGKQFEKIKFAVVPRAMYSNPRYLEDGKPSSQPVAFFFFFFFEQCLISHRWYSVRYCQRPRRSPRPGSCK